MTATVEDIAKELDDETREALVEKMALFDVSSSVHNTTPPVSFNPNRSSHTDRSAPQHMCTPEDVGLSLSDFATATTPDTIERDTPVRVASDLTSIEMNREMEARGVKAAGFFKADAKKLQVEFDGERAKIVEEKKSKAMENMAQEEMELAVERNKTIMSRLLSGELSAWEATQL